MLVLPRSLKKQWEPEIIKTVNEERLLIISPFDEQHCRITRENAIQKNEKIISLADKIMLGYKTKNGQLDKLLKGKEYEEL